MIPIVNQEFGQNGQPISVVAGDVGGTKTNLAWYEYSEHEFHLKNEKKYSSKGYQSFTDMVLDFIGDERPNCISAGVAGPVIKNRVDITNLNWSIDANQCAKETGIEKVYLINDLVANIYGLPTLTPDDFVVFHEGIPEMPGNAAMISPGTGLGEAGMFWDGKYYHPFATEGGHADYAPETKEDIELLLHLQKRYGHVSWERVVSGMGIHQIFLFLCEYRKYQPGQELRDALECSEPAAVISQGSKDGDEICQETMQMFWRNLANETGNIVVKFNGFGGVFIGGGIVPKNLDVLSKEDFLHYYLEVGRMKSLLERAPVSIVLNDRAALRGASFYGAIRYRQELSRS
ncbi:MAG: glucokinase [Saprospiraceae bacterium]|nr:glucokinase [Saprospiraceae bacterium]